MRKFLAVILMLVMLTPSLACAMPVCEDEAQAAATEQPCAGHPPHHQSEKDSDTGKNIGEVSLLKDCMGVDLQATDSLLVKKLPLQNDLTLAGFTEPSFSTWTPIEAAGIRGPPPDWPDVSKYQPSLILTTQRFRI